MPRAEPLANDGERDSRQRECERDRARDMDRDSQVALAAGTSTKAATTSTTAMVAETAGKEDATDSVSQSTGIGGRLDSASNLTRTHSHSLPDMSDPLCYARTKRLQHEASFGPRAIVDAVDDASEEEPPSDNENDEFFDAIDNTARAGGAAASPHSLSRPLSPTTLVPSASASPLLGAAAPAFPAASAGCLLPAAATSASLAHEPSAGASSSKCSSAVRTLDTKLSKSFASAPAAAASQQVQRAGDAPAPARVAPPRPANPPPVSAVLTSISARPPASPAPCLTDCKALQPQQQQQQEQQQQPPRSKQTSGSTAAGSETLSSRTAHEALLPATPLTINTAGSRQYSRFWFDGALPSYL